MISLIKRTWESPTCTAWANQGADAIRLVVLLPLLLANFDKVQVAVWLLFASLAFFSGIINDQLSQAFSRAIALAYGGAKDLSPILPGEKPRGDGEKNWPLIAKLYGTIGSLNRLLSAFGVLLTFAIGFSAIRGLVVGYPEADKMWVAFAVMLGGQYAQQNFRRYAVALRGLNQVAVTNRWQALFSVISAVAGAVAIQLGAKIVCLALVTQFFVVIGVLRLRFILMRSEAGRFQYFKTNGWDRRILGWLWGPFWRGLVQVVANRGGVRVATVVYAHYSDPEKLAALLLTMRLLESIEKVAMAPITSNVPRFGRMLASGRMNELRRELIRAIACCDVLLIFGCVIAGLYARPVLDYLSNTSILLPAREFIVLCLLFVIISVIRQFLIVSIIGNRVIGVGRMVLAFLCSSAAAVVLVPTFDVWGFLVSAYVPVVLLMNIHPIREGLSMLGGKSDYMQGK